MTEQQIPELITLEDSDLKLASSDEDIRGRTVVDKTGEDIGDVKDLLIDKDGAKVRFLRIGSGGFLGIGEDTFLVPVDAITSIADNKIHVDLTRDHVMKGPTYDPAMVRDEGYLNSAYNHYGFLPFWAPGYRYPGYPYYPTVPGRPGFTRY